MKELRIEYSRFGIRHYKLVDVPQSWKELTVDQFLLVAKLYLQELTDGEFLQRFFGLPSVSFDEYQLYRLSELLEFISDCRVRMNHFLIPRVGKMLAPGDRLKGMCFEHFMHVDTAFNRYATDGKDASLDAFVSLLYLKEHEYIALSPNSKNSLFSRSKPLVMPRRLPEVARIEKHIKYAIFLNYIFIKRWLSRAFPFLFPLNDEPEPEKGSKRKPAAPSVHWLDIFDAFVGDDVAVMDKYQTMPATTAFRLLNKRIRDAQKKK